MSRDDDQQHDQHEDRAAASGEGGRSGEPRIPEQPWAQPPDEVLAALAASAGGLAADEVEERRERFGDNRLGGIGHRSLWQILWEQLASLIMALLVVAMFAAWFTGQRVEAGAILAVIVINTVIGFVTEWRAVRSMEALEEMGKVEARVLRDGQESTIAADDLVPGDIVLLGEGDVVPGDLRLLEVEELAVDESALTGESVPVAKDTGPVDPETPLADRTCTASRGTAVSRGRGRGVVVAVGEDTALGEISELVASADPADTPLERKLDHLGRRLVILTLLVAAAVTGVGIWAGRDVELMVETGIALAVAAVPEGLPIVATVALAHGMWKMVRRNALIRRLSSVETLGATTVICADKTGTLTENRMRVRRLALPSGDVDADPDAAEEDGGRPFHRDGDALSPDDHEGLRRAIEVAVLCNGAVPEEVQEGDRPDDDGSGDDGSGDDGNGDGGNGGGGQDGHGAAEGAGSGGADGDVPSRWKGDPMEVALLLLGRDAGRPPADLFRRQPRVGGEDFSRDTMMMGTVHQAGDGSGERGADAGGSGEGGPAASAPFGGAPYRVAVKGAPEAVLDACTHVLGADGPEELDDAARRRWHDKAEELAADGLRILAVAEKGADDAGLDRDSGLYSGLCFLGHVGLLDPPREGVADVIRECRRAGVRVVMMTGDHAATAANVARAVGLGDEGEELRIVEGSELPEDPGAASDEDRRRFLDAQVFARIEPKQKLTLVDLHQDSGEIVAMTGDGVNDAPALRSADIGVAMGERGTQVARESSDMVLQDDNLSSMVAAIEQGRVIFENIRKFVVYLLSGNMGEILAVGVAAAAGMPLPLLPLQILYINMLNDVFPALALGLGGGTEEAVDEPPRNPEESVVTASGWGDVVGYGIVVAGAVMAAFWYARAQLGLDATAAASISFLSLSLGRLAHVFNMRRPQSGWLRNEITRNVWVWAALAICIALLAAAVYVPFLADVLQVTPPTGRGWAAIAVATLIPLVLGQIYLSIRRAVATRKEAE